MAITLTGTAALTGTTGTYVTLPGLSYSATAAGTYRVQVHGTYTTSATVAAIIRLDGTATYTTITYWTATERTTTGGVSRGIYAFGSGTTATAGTATTGTTYGITVDALLTVNAAGTIEFQGQQSGTSVTYQAGGIMTVERIG